MKVLEGVDTVLVEEEVHSEASNWKEIKVKYRGGAVVVVPHFVVLTKKELETCADPVLIDAIRSGQVVLLPADGRRRLSSTKFQDALAHPRVAGQEKAIAELSERLPEFS